MIMIKSRNWFLNIVNAKFKRMKTEIESQSIFFDKKDKSKLQKLREGKFPFNHQRTIE